MSSRVLEAKREQKNDNNQQSVELWQSGVREGGEGQRGVTGMDAIKGRRRRGA